VIRPLLAVALCLSLSGCSVWGAEGGPGGSGLRAPTESAAPPVDAVAGSDGVQRVEVTAGDDLRFTPSVVRAHPGVIVFVFHYEHWGLQVVDICLTVVSLRGSFKSNNSWKKDQFFFLHMAV